MTITVSTDGSALKNPNGPMGWAWADHHDERNEEHEHGGDCDAGGATNGTNQIGELCAILEALRAHPGAEKLVIETDSQYAINCSTTWVESWRKHGWKNSKNQPVKNVQLIKAIYEEIHNRPGTVDFHWVKGHAGNEGNEKCDELARTYAGDCRSGARDGYLPKEGWQALLDSPYAKGTDVPSDARMLMDGELTEQQYRLTRSIADEATEIQDDQLAHRNNSLTDAKGKAITTTEQMEERIESNKETSNEDNTQTLDTLPQVTAQNSNADAHQETHMLKRASGLSVSGTLTFSPPPSTSPSFDGSPRHIRGVIEIEGDVLADGTIEITNVPFHLR